MEVDWMRGGGKGTREEGGGGGKKSVKRTYVKREAMGQ